MVREAVMGTETMVVSPHYLASSAGARILAKGGNAFDAAVAVSACLAVVYPHMTGLGGDSFWLTYSSREGQVRAYNASGRSAYLADRKQYADAATIPLRGTRSAITVPGMADGWHTVQRQYGQLSFAETLEPAIRYAAGGFPLSLGQRKHTLARTQMLAEFPECRSLFLPGGEAGAVGSLFRQRDLAGTLQELAVGGSDAFYRGRIAADIAQYLQDRGGLLTVDDFADHSGEWVAPLSSNYRGYDLYQVPPNSQGFTALMVMNMLESFDMEKVEHGSHAYYQLLIEALKLSFRDRNRYLSDPRFTDIPLDRLLDKSYAAGLADQIRLDQTVDLASLPVGNDTAYAAVVDGQGNAVSFIQSLYFEFGSGIVAGPTGVLLQNRGSFFSLDPLHVNRLEPHKRTFHTLMPGMACRDGRPVILCGAQGGEGQPQTQTALLTRMIDYGMDPQQAINAPRWVWGRTWGEPTQELKLEARIDPKVVQSLSDAGHLVRVVEEFDEITGHAHAIRMDDQGVRYGGADPRSDGAAIGW